MARRFDDAFVCIKIRFGVDVDSFDRLAEFTDFLREIESTETSSSSDKGVSAEARLISFHVGSPPELTCLANPAWIALIVATLANYQKIKENIPIIIDDAKSVIGGIRGLSAAGRAKLEGYLSALSTVGGVIVEDKIRKLVDKLTKIIDGISGTQQHGQGENHRYLNLGAPVAAATPEPEPEQKTTPALVRETQIEVVGVRSEIDWD